MHGRGLHNSRLALALVGAALGSLLFMQHAKAATPSYAAQEVQRSAQSYTVTAGKAFTVWVEFRNTGTATWMKEGKHFVALNVTNPVGRVSAFQHPLWTKLHRPAKLRQKTVRQGEAARVAFALQAPKKPGVYRERFQLAAKDLTWIKGSTVDFTITVTPPPPPYQAFITGQSAPLVSLEPGEETEVWFEVQNIGAAIWKKEGKNFVALNVTNPVGRTSVFRAASWTGFSYRPTLLQTDRVKPRQKTRFHFALTAPATPGTYEESFQLVAENLTWITGSRVTFTVVVAAPAPPPPPPASTAQGEPMIDVGLRAFTEPVVISATQPMTVTTNGTTVGHAAANAQITLSYTNGMYTATGPDFNLTGTTWYTVTTDGAESIVEAVNFENRPAWNTTLNDNVFRGSLSLRASAMTGNVWLVNSLPLEQYLRGIAEAGNTAPAEYQKALIVAARSYAHYHIRTNTKHDEEYFTVDATNDQVYRGYNLELRTPNITKAVTDTAGLEVTYDGQPVVTPYFANTDGRTRAWEEVWSGGPFAWLVSVPVPEDAGMTLYGHGVGMSGHGGLVMAQNGKTYDQILAYFYTGTGLAKQY